MTSVIYCFSKTLISVSNNSIFLAAEQVQSSLRFIVLGDWGGLPNYPYHTPVEEAVAKQMANVSSAYDIQLLLALGDNFYFDGVANDTDPRFKVCDANGTSVDVHQLFCTVKSFA